MHTPRLLLVALLLSAVSLAPTPGRAQDSPPSRYPLRLHVLVIDDTHPTPRLQPNWCSGSIPNVGGDPGADSGQSGSPCGSGGAAVFGGSDDFSGGGRGDLVTPPAGTQALSFTYEGCTRVRVPPGFQSLQARWKKPGKLEVLIPSDSITEDNHAAPIQKCTLTVTLQEFVYLRLPNGSMLKISQEAYFHKPALRRFLSGGSETLQARTPQTVSVQHLMGSPQ